MRSPDLKNTLADFFEGDPLRKKKAIMTLLKRSLSNPEGMCENTKMAHEILFEIDTFIDDMNVIYQLDCLKVSPRDEEEDQERVA